MKIPIALSVFILVVGASFGWHDFRQLAAVRETHRQLVAEAVGLGLAIDPSHPGTPVRATKHPRQNREADAKRIAAEFIAFAKEMEALQENGAGQPDAAMQRRIMDVLERLMSLDSAQSKILIAELRATTDLKDETRQGLLGFSIMMLANDHPQAALALFSASADLFKDSGMGKQVVASALERWAKDDPSAALEWLRQAAANQPALVTDDAKRGMLTGVAAQDPRLAFKLIGELAIKDAANAIQDIVRFARTPEERTATLAALREHLASVADETARSEIAGNSLRTLAHGASQDGFAAGSQWLAAAHLNPAELASVADGLDYNKSRSGETGQWIEWLGATLPPDQADRKIHSLVMIWTQNDYQAAGQWLAATPDGPAKISATRNYAETVARYAPETAAQWALTLPPGKERDATLHNIYQKWPRDDPAAIEAAAAFAKQHGIKE